jgi:hypothetical protein
MIRNLLGWQYLQVAFSGGREIKKVDFGLLKGALDGFHR